MVRPGIEPRCPALQADSFMSEPPGKPRNMYPANQWDEIDAFGTLVSFSSGLGKVGHLISHESWVLFLYLAALFKLHSAQKWTVDIDNTQISPNGLDLFCVFFPKGIEVEYLRIWIVNLTYVCIIIIPSEKSDEDKTKFIYFWPCQLLQELNQLHLKIQIEVNLESHTWLKGTLHQDDINIRTPLLSICNNHATK